MEFLWHKYLFYMSISETIGIIAVIISVIVLFGGLVSVWVNTNVKIAKIETTVNLEVAAIKMQIATYINSNTATVQRSFDENKEEHRSIMNEVKEIRDSIGHVGSQIAKLTP